MLVPAVWLAVRGSDHITAAIADAGHKSGTSIIRIRCQSVRPNILRLFQESCSRTRERESKNGTAYGTEESTAHVSVVCHVHPRRADGTLCRSALEVR
jgi:hypothetical protein